VRSAASAALAQARAALPAGANLRELGEAALQVHLEVPADTNLEARQRVSAGLERSLRRSPGLTSLLAEAADGGAPVVHLFAGPGADLPALARAARAQAANLPGASAWVEGPNLTGWRRLVVRGPELETLAGLGHGLRERLGALPSVEAVLLDGVARVPVRTVRVDRDAAAALGVGAAEVQRAAELSLGGVNLGPGPEGADVFLRIAGAPVEALAAVRVQGRGGLVPLTAVASLVAATEPLQILRGDRQRQVELGVQTGRPCAALVEALVGFELPAGYLLACDGPTD
jgi:multidrug efflux pump subunit AcrB